MKITCRDVASLAESLENALHDNFISGITVLHSTAFVLSFAMHREEKLLVALDHSFPFVSLFRSETMPTTLPGSLNEALRKEMKDGHLNHVSVIPDERILVFGFSKSNDYMEREEKRLYLELIPRKPELVITDTEGKILFVSHETDLSSERVLLRGMKYALPEHKSGIIPENPEFHIDSLKEYAADYVREALVKRNREKHQRLFSELRVRAKRAERKSEMLRKENEELADYSSFRETGEMILTYQNDPDSLKECLNGREYDDSLSPGENASRYFRNYKKAKRTLEKNEEEILRAKKEAGRMMFLLEQAENMEEEELLRLENTLFPKKENAKRKTTPKKPGIPFLYHDGVKISYGRNSSENEDLSFRKAGKNDVFAHVSKLHGNHLIIHQENPSDEVLLFTAELALLLLKKTTGEVDYTPVRNIRKGPKPGQVLMSSHKSIRLNGIRPETMKTFTYLQP